LASDRRRPIPARSLKSSRKTGLCPTTHTRLRARSLAWRARSNRRDHRTQRSIGAARRLAIRPARQGWSRLPRNRPKPPTDCAEALKRSALRASERTSPAFDEPLRSSASGLERNRKFVDSLLEGDGFELSVPRGDNIIETARSSFESPPSGRGDSAPVSTRGERAFRASPSASSADANNCERGRRWLQSVQGGPWSQVGGKGRARSPWGEGEAGTQALG